MKYTIFLSGNYNRGYKTILEETTDYKLFLQTRDIHLHGAYDTIDELMSIRVFDDNKKMVFTTMNEIF